MGDPVINEDFGQGNSPGAPLPASVTNLIYTTNNCPDDGQYTIASSLVGLGNCHRDTWNSVYHDHTGNPNGFMMIINASAQPNVFYTQQAKGLCPGTTYQFSAYVLNLILKSVSGPGFSEPNIAFSIESSTGQVLARDTTGIIPNADSVKWNQYAVYFTTPNNVTDVVVKMTNLTTGSYGNDLILDDITFRACGPIIEAGFTTPNGPFNQDICEGSNAKFTINTTVLTNMPVYQWQLNNGSGWADINGQTTGTLNINIVNAVTGVYQYRLGVGNGSNISSVSCRVYSSPLTVNVNALPVVPAFGKQTVCQGDSLILIASGGATYTWSGPNLAPVTQNPLIVNNMTAANAGTYTLIASSAKGCAAAPVQIPVNVVPKITARVSAGVAVCAGEPAPITASGGLFYKWTPSTGLDHDDIANPVATPLHTTTYRVAISNGGCDDTTQTVTVTVRQNPFADAGANKQIFEGQTTKLNGVAKGDELTSVYWTPATGLSDPTSATPVASPKVNTTYTLNVISQNCGQASSSVFIGVYEKITIPNTFTPNNDGINDLWEIHKINTYPQCRVQIFDRNGQQVFQSSGYAKPWDGTYNGKPLPVGTYYYVIDLKDGAPKNSGWVVIVR